MRYLPRLGETAQTLVVTVFVLSVLSLVLFMPERIIWGELVTTQGKVKDISLICKRNGGRISRVDNYAVFKLENSIKYRLYVYYDNGFLGYRGISYEKLKLLEGREVTITSRTRSDSIFRLEYDGVVIVDDVQKVFWPFYIIMLVFLVTGYLSFGVFKYEVWDKVGNKPPQKFL